VSGPESRVPLARSTEISGSFIRGFGAVASANVGGPADHTSSGPGSKPTGRPPQGDGLGDGLEEIRMTMPGRMETYRRYRTMGALTKHAAKMAGDGWSKTDVTVTHAGRSLVARLLLRPGRTLLDVHYVRPAWESSGDGEPEPGSGEARRI
jgi:hypothetical protein